MRPFRFYKNIRKPNHTIHTHCFVFFVDDGFNEKTYILRDIYTDFEDMDYEHYIDLKVMDLRKKYRNNVKIEGSKLGIWEYEKLLKLGVPKLC